MVQVPINASFSRPYTTNRSHILGLELSVILLFVQRDLLRLSIGADDDHVQISPFRLRRRML